MVAADYFNPTTYTEKLKVPEGLTPSDPEVRGWFILPSGLNSPIDPWVPLMALVPAVLVYILIFMETHISEYVYCEVLILISLKDLKTLFALKFMVLVYFCLIFICKFLCHKIILSGE